MTDVVALGEVMLLLRGEQVGPLSVGSGFTASVAGAEATVAIGLARLGHSVAFCGRVGSDDAGELVRSTLRASGVDVACLVEDSRAPTGLLLRQRRTPSLTKVAYYRTQSAGSVLELEDVRPALATAPRVLHVSGITAVLSSTSRKTVAACVAAASEAGALVSYDVNHRRRLASIADAGAALAEVLDGVDVLLFGDEERAVLRAATGDDDVVAAALAAGVGEVVEKRGRAGATVHTPAGSWSCPAHPVDVIDVVGAGDAFAAGYLSALLDEREPAERLRRGAAVASFSVSTDGDWEGLPTRAELALLDLPPETTVR
jgi:2-dehydro-3-deoxygluconokinase